MRKKSKSVLSYLAQKAKGGNTGAMDDLAELAKHGDRKSQSELFEIYFPVAGQIIRSFVNERNINEQDVDYITNEAFNKFYTTGYWDKTVGKFTNYFHTTLKTCYLDWTKKQLKDQLPTDFSFIPPSDTAAEDEDYPNSHEYDHADEPTHSAADDNEIRLLLYACQEYNFFYNDISLARKIIMQHGLKRDLFTETLNSKPETYMVIVDTSSKESVFTTSPYLKKFDLWKTTQEDTIQ